MGDWLAEVKMRRTAREDWWQPKDPVHRYPGVCRYCGKGQAGADWETGDLHEDGCPAASQPGPDIDRLIAEVERLRARVVELDPYQDRETEDNWRSFLGPLYPNEEA